MSSFDTIIEAIKGLEEKYFEVPQFIYTEQMQLHDNKIAKRIMSNEKILNYLSSSELNRCKKNGLNVLQARKIWYDVLSYTWLTRKLRRKLGHLMQLDLLPVIYQPVIGLGDIDNSVFDLPQFKDLGLIMAKKYMDAEDEAIMKGFGK